jgi:hypothetical protein
MDRQCLMTDTHRHARSCPKHVHGACLYRRIVQLEYHFGIVYWFFLSHQLKKSSSSSRGGIELSA